eukprot:6032760-Pyramimonas_sp.AAC.1
MHKAIGNIWSPTVASLASKTRWGRITSLFSALIATLHDLGVYVVGPWGWIIPDSQRCALVPGSLRAQAAFLDDFSEYVSR